MGQGLFFSQFFDDPQLNHFAALRVDRMRDIGVQFCSSVGPLLGSGMAKFLPALVAVVGTHMIFRATLAAIGSQLPAGHCDEGS